MAIPGLKVKVILPAAVILVFLLVVIGRFQNDVADTHCQAVPRSTAVASHDPKTAEEFLERGDEAFDAGNCKQAIAEYTQALDLNPGYAEAFNNRAYTYMRMQNYGPALKDLDQALRIRPDYVHALMNRGDIYNYYHEQDRKKAIEDYDRILRLGGQTNEPSVCGHRAVAIYSLPGHEGWNVKGWFKLVLSREDICKMKAT
jgi:tetratricopeptide (TPR) repeat protein